MQCAFTTLNKYPPGFREARTFPQRLRHSSCAWSRLTASRLSLLAPERLWGRGRERGKNEPAERAVLGPSIGSILRSTNGAQQCALPSTAVSPVPFCGTYQGVLSHARDLREIPTEPGSPQRWKPSLTRLSEGGVRGLQVDCISNT